jgi:hypothetical protein
MSVLAPSDDANGWDYADSAIRKWRSDRQALDATLAHTESKGLPGLSNTLSLSESFLSFLESLFLGNLSLRALSSFLTTLETRAWTEVNTTPAWTDCELPGQDLSFHRSAQLAEDQHALPTAV